jgi:hypothetical protein
MGLSYDCFSHNRKMFAFTGENTAELNAPKSYAA